MLNISLIQLGISCSSKALHWLFKRQREEEQLLMELLEELEEQALVWVSRSDSQMDTVDQAHCCLCCDQEARELGRCRHNS